ncbi:MAG: site-specific integrase [Atribacterota bacterium]|nr:site-specific integrase [Atribacterota bacterium]
MVARKLYTAPILCPKDRNMDKEWFVYFRYLNPITGERKAFKFRNDLNQIKNRSERIHEGNALVDVIREQLKAGWNPFTKEVKKPDENKTLIEHLQENLNTKGSLSEKTIRSYKDIFKLFSNWLKSKQLGNIFPYYFNSILAKQYSNYLVAEKKYKGKTHNTHLGIIKSWFTDLKEIGLVGSNSFEGIKELPEDKGKNFAFNDDERKKLKDYLSVHNRRLYFACQFLYFLLIRPKELIRMKVEDINFENKTIVIHSFTSKNNNQQSITIPKGLEKIIFEMGLDMAPKHYFVFGHKFNTCDRKMVTINGISGSHRKVARKLGIGEEKSFYSWKHTGACSLYNATKDPYLVMQQCRHSDIKLTMIYLRSLGLTVNERIREAEYNF